MDFTISMPSMPKQMDEFLSLLTEIETCELSEVASSSITTVPIESEALIFNHVSVEPSEAREVLSNSSIAAPSELDEFDSSPTPATSRELEDAFTMVDSATPNEIDEASSALNPTETLAVGEAHATSSMTAPAESEKLSATFSLPEQSEIDESRAAELRGYKVALKRTAISIGRIEKYLAIAAVVVFIASLIIFWTPPFEDVSDNPDTTIQDSNDSQVGSALPTTVVQDNPGTKQGGGVEWQSFRPGSGDQSLNRRIPGSTSENFPPSSAAPNPSQLVAMRTTTEPTDQVASDKALPTRKREKAEKKRVTVDDLITDKKKVTVDDLINDN